MWALDILVIDDDADTAESMAIWLRYHGHRVRLASDGPSAFRAARSKPPDVVLLDLALPGMNGWEVAMRLQELCWEKMPLFIAITGYGRKEDFSRSWQAGIALHLLKPVDPILLDNVLEKFARIIRPAAAEAVLGLFATPLSAPAPLPLVYVTS